MKSLIGLILVIGLVGCINPALPPASQTVQDKDNLVNALGTLGDAAIGLQSQNSLSVNNARIIITFSRDSIQSIKNDEGWKVVIIGWLNTLQKQVPDLSKFSAIINLIKSILGVQ